jgi:hypothetical protein
MDAQSTVADNAALIALVRSLARLQPEEESRQNGVGPEVLAESRFLAARNGLDAGLIDPLRNSSCRSETLSRSYALDAGRTPPRLNARSSSTGSRHWQQPTVRTANAPELVRLGLAGLISGLAEDLPRSRSRTPLRSTS